MKYPSIIEIPSVCNARGDKLLAFQLVYRSFLTLRKGLFKGNYVKTMQFKYVKLAQIICGLGALVVFLVNPKVIEDEAQATIHNHMSSMNSKSNVTRSVMAKNTYQTALLMVGRFSGFSMYPVLILVMFTKYRATQAFLNKTPLSIFLIQNRHALHVYCGWYIMFGSIVHTATHCLRWIHQGNICHLYTNQSGLTGMIVILSVCLIVLPMTIFKRIISFEMRKYAHYFFWVFCIAMTFHAPFWAFPHAGYCCLVFPVLIGWYLLDAIYVKLFMSELIDTVHYKAVQGGVELTMTVSDRFEKNIKGGYGYIMAPWINKCQWHSFSIYEDPYDSRCRHMFVAKIGDWTTSMHEAVVNAPTSRPLWISGPFASPYNNCIDFDNMICVGTGVGITPALSVIENYRDSRRCNLIWAVREISMLVFVLENAVLDEKAVNLIFYTGKEPLPDAIENYNLRHDAHIQIVKSRPNIKRLIPNLINYFENPSSDYNKCKRCKSKRSLPNVSHGIHIEDTMAMNCFSRSSAAVEEVVDFSPSHCSDSIEWCDISNDDIECTIKTCSSEDVDSAAKTICCGCTATTLAHSLSDASSPEPRSPPPCFESGRRGKRNISIYELEAIAETCPENGNPQIEDASSISSSGHQHPRIWEENTDARDFVENNFPKARRDTWGMLYCGARNPVLQTLKHESNKLRIPLHEEVFDW